MPYLNHVLDKGGLGGAGKPRGLWVVLAAYNTQFGSTNMAEEVACRAGQNQHLSELCMRQISPTPTGHRSSLEDLVTIHKPYLGLLSTGGLYWWNLKPGSC